MQPNQNVAGTPNQNAAGAAGAAGASPAGVAGVAGAAGAAGVAGAAGAAAAGAGAAGAAASVANAPATPNLTKTEPKAKEPEPNIMAQGLSKNKSGKGMLYGLIFCLILAVGGIGFGVWTMMDGNTQKEQLNSQISSLKKQNSELQEQISSAGTGSSTEGGTSSTVNAKDYIYVGEWGLKIKIPEGLSSILYNYTSNSNGPAVVVVGADYGGGSIPVDYMNSSITPGVIGLGSIQRYTKGAEIAPTSPPTFVFSDDDFDYYYHAPQELYQVTAAEEVERQIDIVKLVEQMFTTPENYSKI